MLRHAKRHSVAYLALFVALGGTSVAATQLAANSVTSRQVKDRSLLRVDFKSGQLPRGATGPQGPAGRQGPAGPQGPAGAAAVSLWAVVRPDGTLVHGSGVQASNRTNVGAYGVLFNRSIVDCAQVVSIGGYTAGPETNVPPPGQIQSWVSATGPEVLTRTLNVATQTSGGTLEDRPFQVIVTC